MKSMSESNRIEIGQPLPPWTLESIWGEAVPQVEHFKGKPLLILFFSLGCPGCLGRAIPFANSKVYEYNGRLHVIGIHTNIEGFDPGKEQFDKAKAELYIRFPIFRDARYNTTFLDYEAGGTPHWIVADKDGRLVYSIFGSAPDNALLRLGYVMDELLGQAHEVR